jgi:hypothetical protein
VVGVDDLLVTVAAILGAAAITAGAAMIFVPAGWIVAGTIILLAAVGYARTP